MKNILVTGGAGFIGSHLVDALVEGYPQYKIIVIDDYSNGELDNHNDKAKYIELDIRSFELEKVFDEYKPEYVFHFAASVDLRHSVEDPLFDAEVNLLGSINILENCKKHDVKKVIFSSSGGAVYSGDVMPADENTPAIPISPYGISKLSVDSYLHYYHTVFGLEYNSLRYANVYGPRQKGGVVPIFIRMLLNGEKPVQNGDGTQTRDYVYVKDAVEAALLALENNKTGVYTVGTAIETPLTEMISTIKEVGGFDQEFSIGPAKEGEIMKSSLKYDKIAKDFGWKPEYSLEEGIAETIEFMKSKM